jgi:predicted PurR-regulated permease PerM
MLPMSDKPSPPEKKKDNPVNTAIDLVLKIGLLLLVIFLCFKILKPFLSILLWGLIIAIILFPVFSKLNGWLGGRNRISSVIISIVALAILVFPSIWLVNQLVDGVKFLAESFQNGNIRIPPPSRSAADWPLIGGWLYEH